MKNLTEEEKEKAVEVIAKILGVDAEEITPEALLKENFGADSLDEVEIIMELENEFNIQIPDIVAEEVKTVQDCFNCISQYI